MEDDLYYKSQILLEKIREINGLTSEVERLKTENGRLWNLANMKKAHFLSQDKTAVMLEKETALKEELERTRAKTNSLERQLEELRADVQNKSEELINL